MQWEGRPARAGRRCNVNPLPMLPSLSAVDVAALLAMLLPRPNYRRTSLIWGTPGAAGDAAVASDVLRVLQGWRHLRPPAPPHRPPPRRGFWWEQSAHRGRAAERAGDGRADAAVSMGSRGVRCRQNAAQTMVVTATAAGCGTIPPAGPPACSPTATFMDTAQRVSRWIPSQRGGGRGRALGGPTCGPDVHAIEPPQAECVTHPGQAARGRQRGSGAGAGRGWLATTGECCGIIRSGMGALERTIRDSGVPRLSTMARRVASPLPARLYSTMKCEVHDPARATTSRGELCSSRGDRPLPPCATPHPTSMPAAHTARSAAPRAPPTTLTRLTQPTHAGGAR